jgi:hypothetical protein
VTGNFANQNDPLSSTVSTFASNINVNDYLDVSKTNSYVKITYRESVQIQT